MPFKMTTGIYWFAFAASIASVSSWTNSNAAESPSSWETLDPYQALNFYEGNWSLLTKGHEGYRETCSWLAGGGRRHIICRSSVQTDKGVRESLGVYSYDEATKEFVYHGFSKPGSVYTERGHRIPKGFVYTSESGTGTDRVRTRFTITEGEKGHVNTVNETSKAEGPWVLDEKLEYLRTPL